MMRLGAEGESLSVQIFKSQEILLRASVIVKAVTKTSVILKSAQISEDLGEATWLVLMKMKSILTWQRGENR